MFERKLNQVRFITGAVTTPIIFGTLTFVIVQSAIRKELMHQYKLIFLLIVPRVQQGLLRPFEMKRHL